MITHSEYFYKKSLYFNELARFGQFIEYTLFRSPFLLPKVPIWSPFHSKLGPHLVPVLTNLGPHSMWEQCGAYSLKQLVKLALHAQLMTLCLVVMFFWFHAWSRRHEQEIVIRSVAVHSFSFSGSGSSFILFQWQRQCAPPIHRCFGTIKEPLNRCFGTIKGPFNNFQEGTSVYSPQS